MEVLRLYTLPCVFHLAFEDYNVEFIRQNVSEQVLVWQRVVSAVLSSVDRPRHVGRRDGGLVLTHQSSHETLFPSQGNCPLVQLLTKVPRARQSVHVHFTAWVVLWCLCLEECIANEIHKFEQFQKGCIFFCKKRFTKQKVVLCTTILIRYMNSLNADLF